MVLFRLYTFSRNPTEMILCQEEHDIDIVTDVNFGHLLNVVSARFLHSKVTIFFIVVSIPWGNTLRLCESPVSHQTFTY